MTDDDFVRIAVLITKEYTTSGLDVHDVMLCNMVVKAHQFLAKQNDSLRILGDNLQSPFPTVSTCVLLFLSDGEECFPFVFCWVKYVRYNNDESRKGIGSMNVQSNL